jgi:hypothetical protein
VNQSKTATINNNIKTRTSANIIQPTSSSSTPRVSDLDALMAEKHTNSKKPPNHVELKSTIISPPPPPPIVNNIRRSLFSTDSVKVVRPVRSQELKLFSCHLTTDTTSALPPPPPPPTTVSNEIHPSNADETLSTLTPISSEQKPDKNDDFSSNNSTILRDLSEDSLNEHYHIKQLLKSSKLCLSFRSHRIYFY